MVTKMDELQYLKRDGFRGETMIVLPTESFLDYVEHPLVKRLYLTDVGFFPRAEHHFRERKDGIEEYIYMYCMEGSGTIEVDGEKIYAPCKPGLLHSTFSRPSVLCQRKDPWSILWVHFKGTDTEYYPLEECRLINFNSQNATNRMQFLFELLFRVLESNYTLGNFIYISQVLEMILSENLLQRKTQHHPGTE